MQKISNERRTSSSGVKSLTMLKSLRISSGVFPLIMLATVLQPTSLSGRVRLSQRMEVKSIQKRLDVEVVGGEDNLEKHLLINSDELLVPFADICGALAGVVLVLVGIGRRKRLAAMVFAVFENLVMYVSNRAQSDKKRGTDLLEHAGRDVGQRNRLIRLADICNNEHRTARIMSETDQPSSMFLMRTERSTTSLSALNCSLSEVTRRTIFAVSCGGEEKRQ